MILRQKIIENSQVTIKKLSNFFLKMLELYRCFAVPTSSYDYGKCLLACFEVTQHGWHEVSSQSKIQVECHTFSILLCFLFANLF